MRYGVISDVHANLAALRATVRRLQRLGVDHWLCAGDLVGYGPQPDECVETVADLGAVCVAGNHELTLLGRLPEERAGALAQATLRWTRSVVRADTVAFLEALPLTAGVNGVVLAHGSLTDPTEYVRSETAAAVQLRLLTGTRPEAEVLVLGHTHRAAAYSASRGRLPVRRALETAPGERVLVNPGSVGQSRQWERAPRARALLLDTTGRRATFLDVDYDVTATVDLLRRHGFPRACVHHPRDPVRGVVRRVRRLASDPARDADGPRSRDRAGGEATS